MTHRHDDVSANRYNEEYFECGVSAGVSGYMNFGWMPELTIRMAHFLVLNLPISKEARVLDFGCAKGFVVRALRLLDVEAYGFDVSDYAISQVDGTVRKYCSQISGCDDSRLFDQQYEWMIAKDVFEHITESDLTVLLDGAKSNVQKIFAAIPLAANDESGKFVIPSYDGDVTHITAKTKGWWCELFSGTGWRLDDFRFTFPGCKENWTSKFPEGNGFFVLSRQ